MQSKPKITITATISAPVSKVWDYYTDPKHIIKWSFADPSWHSPRAENDLKVGGKFLTRMEAKQGSEGFDFTGTYNEIVVNKSIKYTMDGDDKRKVLINFDGDDRHTNITITFEAESENPLELQKQGWQSILNQFKKVVEEE